MKKTLFLLVPLASILFVAACSRSSTDQDQDQEAVAIEWLTDAEAARTLSAETGKPVLMNFTGSDWCGWCIKLERDVFTRPEFAAFAEEELILLKLDFPQREAIAPELAAQNEALSQKYDIKGFPTILLMGPGDQVLARTGYRPGGAGRYVDHLRGFMK